MKALWKAGMRHLHSMLSHMQHTDTQSSVAPLLGTLDEIVWCVDAQSIQLLAVIEAQAPFLQLSIRQEEVLTLQYLSFSCVLGCVWMSFLFAHHMICELQVHQPLPQHHCFLTRRRQLLHH